MTTKMRVTTHDLQNGGALRVPDSGSLGEAVLQLLRDDVRRREMGQAARQVFERERGAVERIMRLIDAQLQE